MKRVCIWLGMLSGFLFAPLFGGVLSPQDLKVFQDVYEKTEKAYDQLSKSRKSRDAQPEVSEKLRRVHGVSYFKFLLELEHNLRVLTAIESKIKDVDLIVKHTGLAKVDVKRVLDQRAKMEKQEALLIMSRLAEKKSCFLSEREEEKMMKAELRYDKVVERIMARVDRKHKALEKKLKRLGGVESNRAGVKSVKLELDEVSKKREAVLSLVYGGEEGSVFECSSNPFEGDAAMFLNMLIKKRDALLKELRDGVVLDEGGIEEGYISGMSIVSSNLGVILDVSGSMRRHIKPLKKEIKKSFSSAHYHEINGCGVNDKVWTGGYSALKQREETLLALVELVVVKRVDTVYWFCDLADGVNLKGGRQLRRFLKKGDVLFYVKSVGKTPDKHLSPLITKFKK